MSTSSYEPDENEPLSGSVPPEAGEKSAEKRDSNHDLPHSDLTQFVQLIEENIECLGDSSSEEAWKKMYTRGKEANYDWADENWENGDKLWNQLVTKANAFCKESKNSAGMSQKTYDGIIHYLQTGKHPKNTHNRRARWAFRRKCESFFLNTDGILMYSTGRRSKFVLLKGEVEDVVRQVHQELGHASQKTVSRVVSLNFHVEGCVKAIPIVKRLTTCQVFDGERVVRSGIPHVSVRAERVSGRLSVKLYSNGVLRGQPSKPCQLNCSRVKSVGMSMETYNDYSAYVKHGTEAEIEPYPSILPSQVKWTEEGLTVIETGQLVLNEFDAPGVAKQMHELYGHPANLRLRDLMDLRFFCPRIYDFGLELRIGCSFCQLRKRSSLADVTPKEFYSNARYDVKVEWEGDRRKISISPINLDSGAVEKWIRKIEEKNKGTRQPVEEVPHEDVDVSLYSKVLAIAGKVGSHNTSSSAPLLKRKYDCSEDNSASVPSKRRQSLVDQTAGTSQNTPRRVLPSRRSKLVAQQNFSLSPHSEDEESSSESIELGNEPVESPTPPEPVQPEPEVVLPETEPNLPMSAQTTSIEQTTRNGGLREPKKECEDIFVPLESGENNSIDSYTSANYSADFSIDDYVNVKDSPCRQSDESSCEPDSFDAAAVRAGLSQLDNATLVDKVFQLEKELAEANNRIRELEMNFREI